MPLQTFRYAACGGANTLLGLVIYYFSLYHLFEKENADFGFMVFKPHNAALWVSTFVTLFVGFLLNKYVVFTKSNLQGRVQLFRYVLAFGFNLILNYFLLKLLVEFWHWEPFLSQVITTVIIIAISYLVQHNFSFGVKKEKQQPT